ncbi:LPXTG cell wall anchor domain-containing protein [Brevibacterium luteolum]|uniref:LPXTG cell wall anchor domain-containing protein n=1 Tax=Brevibacterium luteolum TaxID=199591 RepID=UPI0021B082D6|nr:LPXTG cell wall anchor domain-containing protein [Brevibacterium luteolum]MCT1874237.1 LPXTG cell wall anchor domain-containing protein [Brevibacterium luteolum]MCT1891462.1 LPXTG cell wall anchor domain-containing protein [Brevibacterium luteolum]MCT1893300.1 LPXTG cell wall anchor domain-containing protein [Brevibacterium luteolum]MCT1924808.1 LPXTG cell wall anchor domain-containing protein [Brevibacterium luteolum]
MTSTILRRLTAGAATAAVVSAGVLIGSSAAIAQPTAEPTETATATAEPEPSEEPSSEPTEEPSDEPTTESSEKPTEEPTAEPSEEPTEDPEDEAPAFDPQVSAKPKEITAADLTNPDKGIEVMVTNLMAGDVVTDSLTREKNTAEGETLTTSLYYDGDASAFEVGQKVDFTVTISREGEEDKTFDFTVTIVGEDEAPSFDPQVSAKPKEITAADLTNPDKGIEVMVTNLMAGDVVTDSLTREKNTAEGETLTASLYYDGDASAFEVGQKVDFTVTISREGEEDKTFDFTVTIVGEDDGEDETAEAKLTISPEKISVADFRNEEKGVKLSIENCEPGASVTFTIAHEDGEPNHEVVATADDEGTAVVPHIYGTGNAVDSAYTGAYNVTATCGDAEATGSFTVTSGSDGDGKGGGDTDKGGDQDSRNGKELPRTGSDLNALYGAAALLAVGAASLAVGRRKKSRD